MYLSIMSQKRISFYDMARGIAMFCILTGHLVGVMGPIDPKDWYAPLYMVTVSFDVPCFFILSGLIAGRIKDTPLPGMRKYVKGKLRTIMLPYVHFTLVFLVLAAINIWYSSPEGGRELFMGYLQDIASLRGVSVYWFLPVLFVSQIMFYLYQKFGGRYPLVFNIMPLTCAVAMTVICGRVIPDGLPTYFGMGYINGILAVLARAVIATGFIWAGYMAAPLFEVKEESEQAGILKRIVLFALGAGLFLLMAYLCFKNEVVDLNYMNFGNELLYFVCALSGSFGVILVCYVLPDIKPLSFTGENSLVIMCTHMDYGIISTAVFLAFRINVHVTRAKVWVLFLTIYGLIALMELVVIAVYNRLIPFAIGKKRTKVL